MYVAVKGGEQAILNSHKVLAEERRGERTLPELSVAQIKEQMGLAVDRVMAEGSLYDRDLAALAIKQAQGDLVEAIFLLRAYRTTLPRFGATAPLDTANMAIRRRISATYKDVPGGQILGPTYDYTHRLLDFSLADDAPPAEIPSVESDAPIDGDMPRVSDILGHEGLIEEMPAPEGDPTPRDLSSQPMQLPAGRDQRLQNLARGDEGFLLALGYSTQRGFGSTHPFAGEIRMGEVAVEFTPPELGFTVEIGEITVSECEMVNQFTGGAGRPPQFTSGYGLAFGHCERKTMAMALVDRALRCHELDETPNYPAQDEEFVMYHSDNVEAMGFVTHLKLPHYVDFQSELTMVRELRSRAENDGESPEVEEEISAEAAE